MSNEVTSAESQGAQADQADEEQVSDAELMLEATRAMRSRANAAVEGIEEDARAAAAFRLACGGGGAIDVVDVAKARTRVATTTFALMEQWAVLVAEFALDRALSEVARQCGMSQTLVEARNAGLDAAMLASTVGRVGDGILKPFLVRWLANSRAWSSTTMPWRREGLELVAAVRATDIEAAKAAIRSGYEDPQELIEWLCVQEKLPDWSPFSDRFPRAEGWVWP